MKTMFVLLIAAVTTVSTIASDLATQIEAKLQSAIKADNPAAAQSWATALAQLRAAENLDESAKMARRAERLAQGYENLIRTAPAFIQAMKWKHYGKEPELDRVLSVGEFLLKAWKAPQDMKACGNLIKALDEIDAREAEKAKAREAEWQAREKARKEALKGGVR